MTTTSTIHHDDRPCHCQNCLWTGEVTECDEIIDIGQRVAPGELMPCGQCPDCGALCQLQDEVDDVDYLRSPKGDRIVATLEDVGGKCGIVMDDEEGWDYDGSGTEYFDGDTLKRIGQIVFLDDSGNEWLESQLVKPCHPLPDNPVSPWDSLTNVDTFMREQVRDALAIVAGEKAHFSPLQKTAMEAHIRNLAQVMLEIRLQNQK